MGQSSATPPAPPGLSAEEKALLEKQGLTLDKFNEILTQGTFDSAQTQDLFRQISGLYKQEKTAGSTRPGKVQTVTNTQLIDQQLQQLSNNTRIRELVAPDQRTITAAELQRAKSDPAYAAQRGYVTTTMGPDEVTPESTRWVLDPVEVEKLKQRVAAETASQRKIYDLSADRYIKALEGKLPVSQGLLDQKTADFILLKEAAARRGIHIDGDTPETATSQTTAGNELVGQFKRTFGLLEDAERRGEIAGGSPAAGVSYGAPLGYASGSASTGPMSLLPTYGGLSQMYAGAGSPYQQQRLLGYQGQVASYNAGRNQLGALTGLLGTGGGYALMSGHPAVGAGLLGLGALTSFL